MPPTVKFIQFSSSGVNPVGSRHLTNHVSFIKQLSASSSGILVFDSTNIDAVKSHSPTKAVLFRVSNMGGGTKVENMRFWSSALPTPVGTVTFNMKIMSAYKSGIALTDASGQVPSTLPTSQNLFRTDGHTALSGIIDTEVSQWIYLNVTAQNDTVPTKIGGDSSFKYRATFDYV